MSTRESYVLAAFDVNHRKDVQYAEYVTLSGLTRGLKRAMQQKADYVFIRRIRPKPVG